MEQGWAGTAPALQGPEPWPPCVLVFRGGEDAAERGRRQPVPDLHGRGDRLRAAGVRPHGHLHQVRQEDERVPHLPAVRRAGRARLQILTQPRPAAPGRIPVGRIPVGRSTGPWGTRQPCRFCLNLAFSTARCRSWWKVFQAAPAAQGWAGPGAAPLTLQPHRLLESNCLQQFLLSSEESHLSLRIQHSANGQKHLCLSLLACGVL